MNFFKRFLAYFKAEDIVTEAMDSAVALSEELTTVFVYGTLRKGFGNHRFFLENSRYVGKDYLAGFKMVSCGGFPAIYPATPDDYWNDPIVGELYEVDAATLIQLDRLEGVPHHYQRATVTTTHGQTAQVYVQEEGHARLAIPSGDWTDARWYREREELGTGWVTP